MTILETILTELHDQLMQGLGTTVERNSPLPEELDGLSLAVLHDGDPGEPEVTMSPLTYHFQHRAELDLFAQGIDRQTEFNRLKIAVADTLDLDRTLGGLVDWVEPMAPNVNDLPLAGAGTIKAASVPIILHFATTNPLT